MSCISRNTLGLLFRQIVVCYVFITIHSPVFAQIPGSADAARIEDRDGFKLPETLEENLAVPDRPVAFDIPPVTKTITLELNVIEISGITAFSDEQIKPLYQDLLNREITLDQVYILASRITNLYHENGYFLSRAFIPAQEIENNSIKVQVVEGYVYEVVIDDERYATDYYFVNLMEKFLARRPISAQDIESFLLRLNDYPGLSVFGTLETGDKRREGGVRLRVHTKREKGSGLVQVDNHGSRFLGPLQVNASYRDSFIKGQETTLSLARSLESDELSFVSLRQEIPITDEWVLHFQGGYTNTEPGFTLEPLEIESESLSFRAGVEYVHTRQLQENLKFSAAFEFRNNESDTLGFELSRDRIRNLEFGVEYDTYDKTGGFHAVNAVLKQGLGFLGASDEGDLNLSRAEADPTFTILEATYSYQKFVRPEWLLVLRATGQISSDPLFSANEFGFGGENFGRAYDFSEITGDDGIVGAAEINYYGIDSIEGFSITPYAFVDGGRVSNQDAGEGAVSAISAGFGTRISNPNGLNFNIALAQPLTRSIETPVNGGGNTPRLRLSLSYSF